MVIAFIIGLFILNVVFGVKLVEIKRGSKLIFARARDYSDEQLSKAWDWICGEVRRGFIKLQEIWLKTQWSVRKKIAKNLRQFARYLHN